MDYKFQRTRIDKISRDKILLELEKAARAFNYSEFGKRDFNKVASISSSTVKREFDTWRKALQALRDYLKGKNLNLNARKIPYNQVYSDKQLFEEMERIWTKLKHRPSRIEWESSEPHISYRTYSRRFKGWSKACLKFIEYKMGRTIATEDELVSVELQEKLQQSTQKELVTDKPSNKRTIPLSLRLKVLNRDNFRCVFCGRSPATDIGIQLQIDHIIPFSKGGKSSLDNLQTLCQECNLGKSNKKDISQDSI